MSNFAMNDPLARLGIDRAALEQLFAADPEIAKSLQATGLNNLGNATGADALTLPSLDNELQLAVTNDRNQLLALQNLKHQTVGNLSHTYPVQSRTGDSELGTAFGAETVLPDVNNFVPWRNTRALKIVRAVSQTYLSAILSKTINLPGSTGGMHGHNLMSTVLEALTHVEHIFWHGNSDICAFQPDSIIKQISDFNTQNLPLNGQQPIYDARGSKLVEQVGTDYQLKLIEEACLIAYKNGGHPSGVVFPAALAPQVKEYINEKIRYVDTGQNGGSLTQTPNRYPTSYGFNLSLAAGQKELAGPARFMGVKNEVVVSKTSSTRPAAPTIKSATAAAAASGNVSQFATADAGSYMYSVHGISDKGEIGPGTTLSSAKAIAAGQQLTLVLTPAGGGSPKTAGFLIARSTKGKTKTKEMIRIPAATSGDTTFVDLNAELPGTAYALLTSPEYARHLFLGISMPNSLMSGARTGESQEAKLVNLELARTDASIRHLIIGFYSPDVVVPHKFTLIKNIGV